MLLYTKDHFKLNALVVSQNSYQVISGNIEVPILLKRSSKIAKFPGPWPTAVSNKDQRPNLWLDTLISSVFLRKTVAGTNKCSAYMAINN